MWQKKNIKKSILIIIILIIALFIASIIFLQNYLLSSKILIPECDQIINLDWKDSCYHLIAQSQQNSEICKKISNQTIMQDCAINIDYIFYYDEENNFQNRLATEKEKIENRERFKEVWTAVALVEGNESLCEKIDSEGLKYGCYTIMAQSKQDPLLCNKILDEDIRGFCKDDFKE